MKQSMNVGVELDAFLDTGITQTVGLMGQPVSLSCPLGMH
jgi:hypothetical protein